MLEDDHTDGSAATYTRRGVIHRGAIAAAAMAGASGLALPTFAQAAPAAPVKGGRLIVGIGQTFEDINVMTAFGYRWGQLMAYAMYDTLVKFDNAGRRCRCSREAGDAEPEDDDRHDPQGREVPRRQGHDGSRTSSGASTASTTPSKPVSNNFLALPKDIWDKAVKIDDTQLRITTKKPTRMVESWRFWFIMPENADTRKPDMGVQPVGTGPFQYKNFVKGDRLELTKFDGTGKPEPYLDNLTFKFLADAAAQVANFLSGDVNYLHDLSVATLPQVEGKKNSKLIPSGIFFEWWQPQMYFGPLADMKVRLALQYAFDKDTDNKVAWAGRGDPTPGTRSRRARTTSARSGRSLTTPTRRRACSPKAGQPNLKLNMMILSDPGPWHREADVLQQGFKKAGITATIQPLPAAQWFDRLYTKRNHEGIAVNAGSLPFPWALIANYMMKATLLTNPPKYPKPVIAGPEAAYNLAFSSANEAQYSLGAEDGPAADAERGRRRTTR